MANVDFIHKKGMYFPWNAYWKDILASPYPMLAWHVASRYEILGRQCDECGAPFQEPKYPGCGVECLIEFSPGNKQRLLCMACKPDLPWYHAVLDPKEEAKPAPAEQQLSLW